MFALKGMYPTKAPRLHEFHALFYQCFWSTVGPEVLKVVLDFLNEGHSL